MNPKYPCGTCTKTVAKSHNAVCCDIWSLWVHIKCNNITKYCYRKLQNSNEPWYCKICLAKVLPFSNLTDLQIDSLMLGKLLASPKQVIIENQLSFVNDHCNSAVKNELLHPDQFRDLKPDITSNLYLHMNISSLSYHFDDFRDLITNCNLRPKIIGLSECQLKKNKEPLANIQLSNYTHEFTSTQSSKGGTMIYIENSLRYKIRHDLTMYKSKEIESTFIEIIESKLKNKIFGCIYKHPKVPVSEFANDFLSPLLEKLNQEKKEIVLMGDFNVNILNCENDKDTSEFIDLMYASLFYPTINIPTRITSTSKTLIDNLFYNCFTKDVMSGNITTSISDHLTLITNKNSNKVTKKQIQIRTFNKQNKERLTADLDKVKWDEFLEPNKNDINTSFELFIQK